MTLRHVNGVYDPGILKAVFLAGGPGSGKSHAAAQLFGVPQGLALVSSAATGLKLVNSDPYFEHFLRKHGVDPGALASLSAADFAALTEGASSPRGKASRVRDAFLATWMRGRLGLIIDGTGSHYASMAEQVEALRAAGYDCYMVFVNTSLEVAQARNAKRPRKLPAALVEQLWRAVQENIGHFQALFGNENLAVVDASSGGPIPGHVVAGVMRFLAEPIHNPIGRAWIAAELAKKGGGAKTNNGRRRRKNPRIAW